MADIAYETRDSRPLTNGLLDMDSSQAPLVSAWLALQHAPQGSADYESLFWAFEEVCELCRSSPDEAWSFIGAAWLADQSKVVAENLSAGPLEDLLANYGESVIDRVEAEASANPTFAFLLGGVWRNEIKEAVWTRVVAARDRRGWDGIPFSSGDIESN
ncbi:hypothetical protein RKE25_19930 [Dyella sp. BiH032]|uniref:DUF6869 domain-containing protein n=1 Tax=Dyella sp. BiH032 TaxID=3075430 RepID=UPI0028937253|nr:hypothetical protein [Dyella sp. BiH032]WNL45655.1 hypothetical protein RKE25_19930 [Dyella sp. BiH032]